MLHLVATYHGGGHGPFGYAVVTTTTADSISSPFGGFRYSRLDADAPPTAETVVWKKGEKVIVLADLGDCLWFTIIIALGFFQKFVKV